MTSNQLTEQQIDLLIENGYDIAHTLENLAENEINSDCFEVFSYSENGRETEWDGKITSCTTRRKSHSTPYRCDNRLAGRATGTPQG